MLTDIDFCSHADRSRMRLRREVFAIRPMQDLRDSQNIVAYHNYQILGLSLEVIFAFRILFNVSRN